jgi:hypothetical protein
MIMRWWKGCLFLVAGVFAIFPLQLAVMSLQLHVVRSTLRYKIDRAELRGTRPSVVVAFLERERIPHSRYMRMSGPLWVDFDRTISAAGGEVGDIPFRIVPLVWRVGVKFRFDRHDKLVGYRIDTIPVTL